MRILLIAFILAAGLSGAAGQESTPFDMSPERPAQTGQPDRNPGTEQQGSETSQPAEDTQAAAETADEPASRFRRFLLPGDKIVLAGEQARRNWAIYLSQRQAASPATLTFGYNNSVVVAPENSSLSVVVNGTTIHRESIASSETVATRHVPVPADLLRPGRNEIGFSAVHRHRTDCSLESTFELWTELAAGDTFLAFADATAGELTSQDELSAVGGNANGKSRIAIVAPSLARLDIASDVMRLAQALSRHINTPDIEISVETRIPETNDLTLIVLLGSASELAAAGYELPEVIGPFSTFAETAPGDVPVFVVSGRDRAQWATALDSLAASVDRPLDVQRDVILTEGWRTPNAPMIFAGKRLSFGELGLRSEQFSGRRYTAEFEFGVPSDFYAEAYGKARILLDAAYTDQVRPGSLINIYVNGSIAASIPITTTRGAVLSHYPINFTMAHIVPGLNTILLEAELRTAADNVCGPGAPADDTPRFALFESSQFDMPTFARIAQRPNLSAFGGTSFPYSRATGPTAVVVDRSTDQGLSTLATLLGRMARAAGRILPVEFVASRDAVGMRNAIILGGVNDIPAGMLEQVGISEESRASWGRGPSGGDTTGGPTLDQWRNQVSGSWLHTAWRNFGDWLQRTFNITSDMLRFAPDEETAFVPSPTAGLVIAQSGNPAGTGTWTVITAPDNSALRSNMAAFVDLRNWSRLSGHITTFNPATDEVQTVGVGQFEFVETMPASIWNYRLIVANWLSTNILSYSLILILACILLGGTTTVLLGRLGRRR